jgi:hypothetical protein
MCGEPKNERMNTKEENIRQAIADTIPQEENGSALKRGGGNKDTGWGKQCLTLFIGGKTLGRRC